MYRIRRVRVTQSEPTLAEARDGSSLFRSEPAACTRMDNSGSRYARVEAKEFPALFSYDAPVSAESESVRLLAMKLSAFLPQARPRRILITSAGPGEGKTTMALNLVTTLAEDRSARVLLIDADLHRGSAGERIGVACPVGLAGCLRGDTDPHSAIRLVEPFGWYLLSHGSGQVEKPSSLLRPERIDDLLHTLAPDFDWIVVDSPPVFAVSDALSLAPRLDATLVVARAGLTPEKDVEKAVSLIGRKYVAGIVVNGVDASTHQYSKYYKSYRAPLAPPAASGSGADS